MARLKKIDFEAAKQQKTILTGLVRVCDRVVDVETSSVTDELLVECGCGVPVIIPKEQVIDYPYSKSIASLVGDEIHFVITDVLPDNIVYGSMKKAHEIKIKPTMDKLNQGEVLIGEVMFITKYGAYINVDGVEGLMKNYEFSNDASVTIGDKYPEHSKIKVQLLKYTETGKIIFTTPDKYKGSSLIQASDIRMGQVFKGIITGVYPDRVYVNILPGIDCMCRYPQNVMTVKEGLKCYVSITKTITDVETGKLKVRAKITNIEWEEK